MNVNIYLIKQFSLSWSSPVTTSLHHVQVISDQSDVLKNKSFRNKDIPVVDQIL